MGVLVGNSRLVIVGSGDIAARTAEMMAMVVPSVSTLVVGRNPDSTARCANLARLAARQVGRDCSVSSAVVESLDGGAFADELRRFRPSVIFLAVSEQPWHVLDSMPAHLRGALGEVGFGPWLPVHLAPVTAAMVGIRDSGTAATVVNVAFPDAVNPMLHRIGLGPDLGVGNVANCVPGLAESTAEELSVDVSRVRVRFVCHHFVSHRVGRRGESGGAPFAFHATVDGRHAAVDTARVLDRLAARKKRLGGRTGQWMTAASSARVLMMLLDCGPTTAHAPGFGGRVGGIPVRCTDGEVHPDLDGFLSEQEARDINEGGQVWDGIARIDDDGTAWFTDQAVDGMREALGYECTPLRPADAAERSRELRGRFAEFREKVLATR
jgi:hypothetical protein